MQNVRFWEFVNGDWVKLTLRPDEPQRWERFAREDEGWSREILCWLLTGDSVVRYSAAESRDCDGKHGHYQDDLCPLENLRAVPCLEMRRAWDDEEERPCLDEKGAPLFRPSWSEYKPARCYDQFAEAAGY